MNLAPPLTVLVGSWCGGGKVAFDDHMTLGRSIHEYMLVGNHPSFDHVTWGCCDSHKCEGWL